MSYIIFNGKKYYASGNGYYKHKGHYLHRDMWEYYRGEIPEGFIVHHINGDKEDNRPENLECIPEIAHRLSHSNDKRVRSTPAEKQKIIELWSVSKFTIAKISQVMSRSNAFIWDVVHGNKREHIFKNYPLTMELTND